MSRMAELDAELHRLFELDEVVRSYLACMAGYEAGDETQAAHVKVWRHRLEDLTAGEVAYETFGGQLYSLDGKQLEVGL